MDKVKQFPHTWFAYETFWGSYVTDRKGKVANIFFKPDGQEINTEKLNVIVHNNGIEFLEDQLG